MRESDRAMHLMGDRGPDARRFATACLARSDRKQANIAVHRLARHVGGGTGCGALAREHREVLLHRLKFPQRSSRTMTRRSDGTHSGDRPGLPDDATFGLS